MLRILTASSILALAAVPAIAQQTGTMTQPHAPTAPVAADTPPTPAAPEAMPAPTEPSVTTTTTATVETAPVAVDARAATVTKLVDAEFPAYDANKNGDLDQPEFAKWVVALRTKAEQADPNSRPIDDAAKAKWAKDAFAAADTDKSKKVNKTEMSKFLLG